jgi:hypothetical protein
MLQTKIESAFFSRRSRREEALIILRFACSIINTAVVPVIAK